MPKKVRDILGFEVMDEIRKGTTVYGADRIKADYAGVKTINNMAIKAALEMVDSETAMFWTVEEEEPQIEERK